MVSRNARPVALLTVLLVLLLWSQPSWAEEPTPPALQNISIEANIGKTIPLNLEFTESTGRRAQLVQYFNHDRPVIIAMVYYSCPMLCTVVLNSLAEGLKQLAWTPGQEFDILTISIDPTETPQLAAAKKEAYLQAYGRPGAAQGWHFFVGQQPQIKALADALGFRYRYDEQQKQFAHGAGIFVMTPKGKLSQCLYGIEFPEKNLRLSLVEASEGKVGSTFDKLVLFCYHYDPTTQGYTLFATRLMQVAGVLTVLILGGVVGLLWYRERRQPPPMAMMPPDEKPTPTSSGVS